MNTSPSDAELHELIQSTERNIMGEFGFPPPPLSVLAREYVFQWLKTSPVRSKIEFIRIFRKAAEEFPNVSTTSQVDSQPVRA